MIYLLLAIISSCTISVVMRLSSKWVSNSYGMLCWNYLICLCVSLFHQGNIPHLTFNSTLTMGFMQGLLYLVSFVLYQRNIAQNGMILSGLFMKLGLIVPILLSVILFHEIPSIIQIIGIILAFLAMFLMNYEKGNQQNTLHLSLFWLFLMGGLGDAMSKVFEYYGNIQESSLFLIYTFLFAFLLCFILCIYHKEKWNWKMALFGSFIGVPNYYSAYFLLAALKYIPAIMVYPIFSIATILLITFIGFIFFKERLKKQQIFACLMILLSLYLLNI